MKKSIAVLSLLLALISCNTVEKSKDVVVEDVKKQEAEVIQENVTIYNFSAMKGYDYSQVLLVISNDGKENKMRIDGQNVLIKRVNEDNYESLDGVYKLELKKDALVVYKNKEKKEYNLTEHKSLNYASVDQKKFLYNFQAINNKDLKMLVFTYGNKANIRINANTRVFYKNKDVYESEDKKISIKLVDGKAIYKKGNEVIEFKDVKTKDMYYALEIREYIFNFINRKANSKIMLKISPDSDVLVFRKDKKNYKAKKVTENEFKTEANETLKLIEENKKLKLIFIDKNNKSITYDDLKTKDPFFAR